MLNHQLLNRNRHNSHMVINIRHDLLRRSLSHRELPLLRTNIHLSPTRVMVSIRSRSGHRCQAISILVLNNSTHSLQYIRVSRRHDLSRHHAMSGRTASRHRHIMLLLHG